MGVESIGRCASSVSSPTHLHSSIMRFLVALALVGVASCAPVEKTVAIHAANSPLVTSYTAAASPLLSFGSAIAPAISPPTYSSQTVAAPSVYRVPTPVVYHAPAPAPIVVKSPPQVIVKTVEVPAPAPAPIIK